MFATDTATLTNEGNLTVYNAAGYGTTATTFHVNVSGSTYPAYCGDHDDHAPESGDYSYYEVTSSNTTNADNVRRVIAYVIDKYGNNYSSIDRETRVKISIAVNNAKHGEDKSLGEEIKEAAYAAYSSAPLTGSETTFTISDTTLTTSSSKTTITLHDGSTASVYKTDSVTITGNSGNNATITLPSGVYMGCYSGWYGPGETVTIENLQSRGISFAIAASVVESASGTKNVTFTGESGLDVYYLYGGTDKQYLYWGVPASAKTVSVSISYSQTVGYLRILKTSDTASTSSSSGCAGAVFTVKDSTGTAVATATVKTEIFLKKTLP